MRLLNQVNEALKQRGAAALPTPEKVQDAFLLKQVKAARAQAIVARAKAKAARLGAEKTLNMACNALRTVQSRHDEAKFTANLIS